MRVVLLVEALTVGGLPNYVLMLARMLKDQCEVLVAHGNAPLPSHLETSGLTLAHWPGLAPTADEPATEEALQSLLDWSPDLVHVHLCSNVAMIERLLTSGLPLVRSFHDLTSMCLRRGRRRWPSDRCQRALGWSCAAWGCMILPPQPGARLPEIASLRGKLQELRSYRQFDATITCSHYMVSTLRLNGFAPGQVHLIPNFTPFQDDAVATEAPPKLGGRPGIDRPVELLFVGQAVAGKGLEILIAALPAVAGSWRLTVLADGPRLGPARTLAASLGLLDQIRFPGWLPHTETRQHYLRADLVVMPSIIDEALPLVGIEAMSLGAALVGFAVGGIPDYLIDGITGVLVGTASAESLAAGLTRAIGDPDHIPRWSKAGRAMVARNHTQATHLAAVRRVYDRVVQHALSDCDATGRG